MNIRSNPDTTLPAVTTGPLPSSRKIFATPDARIASCMIAGEGYSALPISRREEKVLP